MSYALGLGADRPRPRGILAFSGFLPTVEGWQRRPRRARRACRCSSRTARRDPVIAVEFAREAQRSACATAASRSPTTSPDAATTSTRAHLAVARDVAGSTR